MNHPYANRQLVTTIVPTPVKIKTYYKKSKLVKLDAGLVRARWRGNGSNFYEQSKDKDKIMHQAARESYKNRNNELNRLYYRSRLTKRFNMANRCANYAK